MMSSTDFRQTRLASHSKHQHTLRSRIDSIRGLTNHSIRRLARRGGVNRIRRTIYDTTRDLIEAKLREIIQNIILYTDHADRKTVNSLDVVLALQKTPGFISKRPPPLFTAGWYPMSRPQQRPQPKPAIPDPVAAPTTTTTQKPEPKNPVSEGNVKLFSTIIGARADVIRSIKRDRVMEMGWDMEVDTEFTEEDDLDFDFDDDYDSEEIEQFDRIDVWRHEVAWSLAGTDE